MSNLGCFMHNTKNNLHFKKKKTPLEMKIHVCFVRFPQHLHKTLQVFFSMSHLLILLILHLVRRMGNGGMCGMFRVVKGHLTGFGGARNPERFPPCK